jgi:hypothetical protein
MWRVVADIGRRDQKHSPSSGSVRRVKAAYWLLATSLDKRRAIRPQLLFDSFRRPLEAGVRNGRNLSRRVQYRAGFILIDIDLRRDSQVDELPMVVVGQCLNAAKPDQPVPNSRVFLLKGRRFIAQTISSDLGEFNFQFAEGKNWKLAFEIGDQEATRISLPDLMPRFPKTTS